MSGWHSAGTPRSSRNSLSLGTRTNITLGRTQEVSTEEKEEKDEEDLPPVSIKIEKEEDEEENMDSDDSTSEETEVEEIVLDVKPERLAGYRSRTSEEVMEDLVSVSPPNMKLESQEVNPVFSQVTFKREPSSGDLGTSIVNIEKSDSNSTSEFTRGRVKSMDFEKTLPSAVTSEESTNKSFSNFSELSNSPKRSRSQRFSIGTRTAQFQEQIISQRKTKDDDKVKEDDEKTDDISDEISKNESKSENILDSSIDNVITPIYTIKESKSDFNRPTFSSSSSERNDTPSRHSVRDLRKIQSPPIQPSRVSTVSQAVYEKRFLKYFKLTSDHFVEHSLCSYQQAINIRGRMYISNNHVCFHSKFYRRAIPFSDIQYIQKQISALILENAFVLVEYSGKRHVFSELQNRDAIFSLLQTFLPNSVLPNSPGLERTPSFDNSDFNDSGKIKKRNRSLSGHLDSITEKGSYVVQSAAKRLTSSVQLSSPKQEELILQDYEPTKFEKTLIDLEAHSNFHLASDERVFESSYCRMKRKDIFQSGRLYLTQHYLCFRTIVDAGQTPQFFQLSFELIDKVEMINIAQIFSTGIRIVTKAPACEESIFTGILEQKNIFNAILNAMKFYSELDCSLDFIEGNGRELFRKHFVHTNLVPTNEVLLATTRCILHDPVIRRGHLYITESFICYHVINYKSEYKKVISLNDLESLRAKGETLILSTSSMKVKLESILNIDHFLNTIRQQRALHSEITLKEKPNRNSLELKKHQQRFTIGGYQFSASSFFMKSSIDDSGDYQQAAKFRLPDDSNIFDITVNVPWPLAAGYAFTENDLLSLQTEQKVRTLLMDDNLTISSPKKIDKGERPGEWNTWYCNGKVNEKYVFVIVARKKHLPPRANSYQDIVFTYQQLSKSSTYPERSFEQLEEIVMNIWNSFTPILTLEYDTGSMFYQLESLSCDYPAYSWVISNLDKVPPELISWADEFFLSIIHQIQKADIKISKDVLLLIPSSTRLYDNPMYVVHTIQTYNERQCDNEIDWIARVSNYLSWVIQYKYPGFTWQNVLQVINNDSVSTSIKDILRGTIHFLLHLRRGGSGNTFLATSIEIKAGDSGFLKNFSFNERFAYHLLENYYFRYFLDDEDVKEFYAPLLAGLLKNADTEELHIPICKEIAWYALQESGKSSLLQQKIIPSLFRNLSSNNELLVRAAGSALVNIAANCDEAKSIINSLSIQRFIISRFLEKSYAYSWNTLQIILRLLATCTNSLERQIELTKNNGLTLVTNLLKKNYLLTNEEMFIDIISTIWKLVNDGNRPLLCSGKTVSIITEKLMSTNDNHIIEITMGTLIALCCKNEFNCSTISELGITSFLADTISTKEDFTIIKYSLLLLLCISNFEETRELVQKENLMASVSCWADYGDKIISQIATHLYLLLNNTAH